MTDTFTKALQAAMAAETLKKPVSVAVLYSDGSTETVNAPVPVNPDPPYIIRVNSLSDVKTFKSGYVYIPQTSLIVKPITINVPNVTIDGVDVATTIDCSPAARWKEVAITYTSKAADCTVKNLTVVGHDGAEFIRLNNTPRFTMDNVHQKQHPTHKGGVTVLATNSSDGLKVTNFTDERTARYGIWLGNSAGKDNRNGSITDFDFGPCAVVEDENSSGLASFKKTHLSDLHGGGWSEHCLRGYGLNKFLIARGKCHNPHNKDGKQAAKIMSGQDVRIEDVLFEGSTRFGRDQNDPPNQTLKNCDVNRCTFTEWVRIDKGADVAFKDCTIPKFDMQGGKATRDGVVVKQ